MSGIMIHEGVYITRIRSVCGVCEGKWNTCGNWFHPSDAIMVFLNCMQQQAASLSGRAAQCQTTPNNVISKPSTSTAVINKALIDTLNRLQSAVCVCAKVCGMACSVSVWVCVCVGGGGVGKRGEYGISFITITDTPVDCYRWVAVTLCVWRSTAPSWGSWWIRVSPVPSRWTFSHSFGPPWTWWCSHAELARIVDLYPFSLKPSNTACISWHQHNIQTSHI